MEFLALMAALGVYAWRGEAAPVQRDGWFHSLRQFLAGSMSGRGLQIAALLIPVVGLQLAYLWVGGVLGGLLELALLVFVLLYSLGRGNLGAAVEEYLQRWSRGDFEAARHVLAEDLDAGAEQPEDPASLHRAARRRLYLRAFERLYAVTFWFVLAGPAGALAYRLARIEDTDSSAASAVPADRLPLLQWLEWVPARLLALGFALVGDFDACLHKWRDALSAEAVGTADVLEACGNAALDLQEPEAESPEQLVARGSAELESVQVLHRRALVVWLVVIALFAMIG